MPTLLEVLATVAPGTELREAIDNMLKAHMGALIVVGGEPDIDEDAEAGFRLDVAFRHTRLYELAKMDGAILLDRELRRIRRANVELIPKRMVASEETGMRHRAAERVAKTRDAFVIVISERRQMVTVYLGNQRYPLHDRSFILARAGAAMTSLGRYDRLYRAALRRLDEAEREGGAADFALVVEVLERNLVRARIRNQILVYIVELGQDGRLIDLGLEDYPETARQTGYIVRDYARALPDREPPADLAASWGAAEWARYLGYDGPPERVEPRGVRILHTDPKLPETIIERVLQRYPRLSRLQRATVEQLLTIEGVGSGRAERILALVHGSGPTHA